jgi:hypothetical protein
MHSTRHGVGLFVTLFAALIAAPVATARGQIIRPTPPFVPPQTLPRVLPQQAISIDEEDNRSGPRLGVAYLVGGSVTADRDGQTLSPLVSLFGWQFEHQFPTGQQGGPIPMTEFVALLGGMEQGRVLPSVSWLLGLRQPSGWEGGIGPTLTGAGFQLAVAAGRTQSIGTLNIPITVAVAPGRRGASISLTTGFNRSRNGR